MKLKHIYFIIIALFFAACEEEVYQIPVPSPNLQNDCIKRTLGPNMVGLDLEFAYAMALPQSLGKLEKAEVVASIPGATGTYLEHNAYYTNGSGQDVPVQVGEPSVTSGAKSEVTFTADTSAATLRYFYRIPEEARGKAVSFTFSAKASNGQTVSYDMGPYQITNMDIKLDLVATDGNAQFISIEDMAVYNATDAATNANKIDLVYLYRALDGVTFKHSLVSPAADVQYLPGVTLPTGASNSTKVVKSWNLRDQHLARSQYGIYIDEVDLQQINFTDAPNYAINLKAEAGTWVETADGKYRAYIFVNKVNDGSKNMTISIKRLQMKY